MLEGPSARWYDNRDTMIQNQASFRIEGGAPLHGDIAVQGGKNAALKLIAACLLTSERCVLSNVPDIEDVRSMLRIIEAMGGEVTREGSTVAITAASIDPALLPAEEAKKVRASVVFAGPLVARFGSVTLPYPGGDNIGNRSVGTHLDAFESMGCSIERSEDSFTITRTKAPLPSRVVLNEFSVTATENMIMFAAAQETPVEIMLAAQEPHIQNLMEMVTAMGASAELLPRNIIRVSGSKNLRGAEITVRADYIEAGTFVAMALAVGGEVRITNCPISDMAAILHLVERAGATLEYESESVLVVRGKQSLRLGRIQTMIYPGFPTDLQAPFGVLATQCEGTTLIHDPLFEGRLQYLKGLEKMGATVRILDPHRAEVDGPTSLSGVELMGEDIRGAMSFIIAGMVASGTTILHNAYQADRGYERIEQRLSALGAHIERI